MPKKKKVLKDLDEDIGLFGIKNRKNSSAPKTKQTRVRPSSIAGVDRILDDVEGLVTSNAAAVASLWKDTSSFDISASHATRPLNTGRESATLHGALASGRPVLQQYQRPSMMKLSAILHAAQDIRQRQSLTVQPTQSATNSSPAFASEGHKQQVVATLPNVMITSPDLHSSHCEAGLAVDKRNLEPSSSPALLCMDAQRLGPEVEVGSCKAMQRGKGSRGVKESRDSPNTVGYHINDESLLCRTQGSRQHVALDQHHSLFGVDGASSSALPVDQSCTDMHANDGSVQSSDALQVTKTDVAHLEQSAPRQPDNTTDARGSESAAGLRAPSRECLPSSLPDPMVIEMQSPLTFERDVPNSKHNPAEVSCAGPSAAVLKPTEVVQSCPAECGQPFQRDFESSSCAGVLCAVHTAEEQEERRQVGRLSTSDKQAKHSTSQRVSKLETSEVPDAKPSSQNGLPQQAVPQEASKLISLDTHVAKPSSPDMLLMPAAQQAVAKHNALEVLVAQSSSDMLREKAAAPKLDQLRVLEGHVTSSSLTNELSRQPPSQDSSQPKSFDVYVLAQPGAQVDSVDGVNTQQSFKECTKPSQECKEISDTQHGTTGSAQSPETLTNAPHSQHEGTLGGLFAAGQDACVTEHSCPKDQIFQIPLLSQLPASMTADTCSDKATTGYVGCDSNTIPNPVMGSLGSALQSGNVTVETCLQSMQLQKDWRPEATVNLDIGRDDAGNSQALAHGTAATPEKQDGSNQVENCVQSPEQAKQPATPSCEGGKIGAEPLSQDAPLCEVLNTEAEVKSSPALIAHRSVQDGPAAVIPLVLDSASSDSVQTLSDTNRVQCVSSGGNEVSTSEPGCSCNPAMPTVEDPVQILVQRLAALRSIQEQQAQQLAILERPPMHRHVFPGSFQCLLSGY
jgi:hypothetical protein